MDKVIRSLTLTMVLLSLMFVFHLQQRLIIPVVVKTNNSTIVKLQSVGINSQEIAKSVEMVSNQTKLSKEFLIALMTTESNGNKYAVSCKGYKGLMQIPHSVYYTDANILIGARIFLEKMQITNQDLEKAICLYKGYPINSIRGLQQARKVISIYNKLSKMEV